MTATKMNSQIGTTMKYEVSAWLKDSELTSLGIANSKYKAREIIIQYAKTFIGDVHVAAMTYDLVYNSTVSAMINERVTHIREDWEGNWTLIWFDGPPLIDIDGSAPEAKIHDKFFFVHEIDD